MPTAQLSKTALMHTSTKISPELIAKHTGAYKIRSMKHNGGWLHIVECKAPKDFDEYDAALKAIEGELRARCFMPILDDDGSTEGRIVLNPSFFDDFTSEEVWKRERSSRDGDGHLLIPGLKRLSRELKVDFVQNVHGTDGKRKREPVQPFSSALEPEATEEKKKPAKMPPPPKKQPADAAEASFAGKALDAVVKSHAETVASKDETIRALTMALAAKDDLVRTQAALIAAMQK